MRKLRVQVRVWSSHAAFERGDAPIISYIMNHRDDVERRRLGQECARAFEVGQLVMTWGVS
jgi:hypothetical protein